MADLYQLLYVLRSEWDIRFRLYALIRISLSCKLAKVTFIHMGFQTVLLRFHGLPFHVIARAIGE